MYLIVNGRIKNGDMWIPDDPDNKDFMEYQAWVSAGNTAAFDIASAKAHKRLSIEHERAELLSAPVEYNGNMYDASPMALFNLISTLIFLLGGNTLPVGFVWRDADNNNVPLTVAELSLLGGVLFARNNAVYAQSFVLKDQLLAAQTIEEIDSIAWPVGP